MKNFKYLLVCLVSLILASYRTVFADLAFHGGYTFETFDGQKATAVYISVFNGTNKDIIIKDVQTNICKSAEIHSTSIDKDIVRMRKEKSLTVKSKDQFFFQPGGTHIMLMGLVEKLEKGKSFTLTFKLENNKLINAEIMILDNKLRKNLLEEE